SKEKNISKYLLLLLGGFLILVPLVSTLFGSFKTTPDIMNYFFRFPNPATLENFRRLLAVGFGHYFWNSAIITFIAV
ncbi:carbohydrate ABC transporter permease, partial [Enterococcus faecium]